MDSTVLAACIQAAAGLIQSGRVPVQTVTESDDAIAQLAIAIYSDVARLSQGRFS
jgi:hypothetical protein